LLSPRPTYTLFPYTTLFRSTRYDPAQATIIMTSQQPAMMRKLKNGISTGGQFSGGMLSSPTSAAVRLSESIRLPKGGGSVIAKRDRKSTRLNSSHVAISYAV